MTHKHSKYGKQIGVNRVMLVKSDLLLHIRCPTVFGSTLSPHLVPMTRTISLLLQEPTKSILWSTRSDIANQMGRSRTPRVTGKSQREKNWMWKSTQVWTGGSHSGRKTFHISPRCNRISLPLLSARWCDSISMETQRWSPPGLTWFLFTFLP